MEGSSGEGEGTQSDTWRDKLTGGGQADADAGCTAAPPPTPCYNGARAACSARRTPVPSGLVSWQRLHADRLGQLTLPQAASGQLQLPSGFSPAAGAAPSAATAAGAAETPGLQRGRAQLARRQHSRQAACATRTGVSQRRFCAAVPCACIFPSYDGTGSAGQQKSRHAFSPHERTAAHTRDVVVGGHCLPAAACLLPACRLLAEVAAWCRAWTWARA